MSMAATVARKSKVRPGNPVDRLTMRLVDDMAGVDSILTDQLNSSAPLIPKVAAHLIQAGGKRIRPLLTLAAARLCGYTDGRDHIRLAAAVEFIHTATLLHDDVVDGSAMRRGRPAANRLWGNKPSILVGDFLFSRAFQLMVETGKIEVLRVLSAASAVIAEGEVLQLATANNLSTTHDQHLAVIRAKTAALFSSATESGAMVTAAPPEQIEALRVYGDALGIAFQLVDDALDYAGVAATIGKDAGDDFHEGKVTAPVLYAYANAQDDEAAFWTRTIEKSDYRDGDLEEAMRLIAARGAVTRTIEEARGYGRTAHQALSIFPASELRDDLLDLIDYVIERDH